MFLHCLLQLFFKIWFYVCGYGERTKKVGIMKKILSTIAILFLLSNNSFAQQNNKGKNITLPSTVKSAFIEKYPNASKVSWERKDDDYEAKWGEGHSVTFTPSGKFIEETTPVPQGELPEAASKYIKMTYNSDITRVGKVSDRYGKTSYVADVKGHELVFDMNGRFIKVAKQ